MFNKTVVVNQRVAPAYPQEITIKKPSSANDLRLLREMQEEILKDLVTENLIAMSLKVN